MRTIGYSLIFSLSAGLNFPLGPNGWAWCSISRHLIIGQNWLEQDAIRVPTPPSRFVILRPAVILCQVTRPHMLGKLPPDDSTPDPQTTHERLLKSAKTNHHLRYCYPQHSLYPRCPASVPPFSPLPGARDLNLLSCAFTRSPMFFLFSPCDRSCRQDNGSNRWKTFPVSTPGGPIRVRGNIVDAVVPGQIVIDLESAVFCSAAWNQTPPESGVKPVRTLLYSPFPCHQRPL
jgi:hypothetical protein